MKIFHSFNLKLYAEMSDLSARYIYEYMGGPKVIAHRNKNAEN